MSKEAMKLALEALEGIHPGNMTPMAEEYWNKAIITLREALAEQPAHQEPEFFTHNVEQPYDWSEWVCPDPKSYLMKCCDCGLVHEAEFGVVRYKSETEREDCEPVDDPNLQAVFRMRRSEPWSPADTAHRAGGLPMEQPAQQEPVTLEEYDAGILNDFGGGNVEWWQDYIRAELGRAYEHYQSQTATPQPAQQEPVAWMTQARNFVHLTEFTEAEAKLYGWKAVYTSPPTLSLAQRTWVGLTEEERDDLLDTYITAKGIAKAIEAKLKEKNT